MSTQGEAGRGPVPGLVLRASGRAEVAERSKGAGPNGHPVCRRFHSPCRFPSLGIGMVEAARGRRAGGRAKAHRERGGTLRTSDVCVGLAVIKN